MRSCDIEVFEQDRERQAETERLFYGKESECEPRLPLHKLLDPLDRLYQADVEMVDHFYTERLIAGFLAVLVHRLEHRLTRTALVCLIDMAVMPRLEAVCPCPHCYSPRQVPTEYVKYSSRASADQRYCISRECIRYASAPGKLFCNRHTRQYVL